MYLLIAACPKLPTCHRERARPLDRGVDEACELVLLLLLPGCRMVVGVLYELRSPRSPVVSDRRPTVSSPSAKGTREQARQFWFSACRVYEYNKNQKHVSVPRSFLLF